MLTYVTRLIGRDEADDVTQDVFVKVARSADTLADPSKLSSWIYAIALNTVRDLARSRSSHPDRPFLGSDSTNGDEASADPLLLIPDARPRTPEQAAIRNEMVACYLDHVLQLPRHYYSVYVLSEFEQLTNQDIARRLSVSLGTVKIRLHRARARLHEALRRACRCYYDERGELMGTARDEPPPPAGSRRVR